MLVFAMPARWDDGFTALFMDQVMQAVGVVGAVREDVARGRALDEVVGGDHVGVHCKESTRKMYRSVVERFIVPSYGSVAVEEVERKHINALHLDLRHIPYQANRALEIGSKLFNLAEEWKLRTGGNPCKYVRKYPERKRERFLTEAEFRHLGAVLNEMEAEGRLTVYPAAAIRLLMLTGCRRNEIVEFAWKHVDLEGGEIRLADSKTGARLVPLSPAAARVLEGLPRLAGNPWVVPGTKPGRRLPDLNHYWDRVRAEADLADVRLHDLRHSFASRALALGESLSMMGLLKKPCSHDSLYPYLVFNFGTLRDVGTQGSRPVGTVRDRVARSVGARRSCPGPRGSCARPWVVARGSGGLLLRGQRPSRY